MGLEDVDERVEWEARRVVAAFGVKEWDLQSPTGDSQENYRLVGVGYQDAPVLLTFDPLTARWVALMIYGTNRTESAVFLTLSSSWSCRFHPSTKELMACGLYRLGFEDEEVLGELNHPFSAHEQVELRLSMPHEFWPQSWLDEEAK